MKNIFKIEDMALTDVAVYSKAHQDVRSGDTKRYAVQLDDVVFTGRTKDKVDAINGQFEALGLFLRDIHTAYQDGIIKRRVDSFGNEVPNKTSLKSNIKRIAERYDVNKYMVQIFGRYNDSSEMTIHDRGGNLRMDEVTEDITKVESFVEVARILNIIEVVRDAQKDYALENNERYRKEQEIREYQDIMLSQTLRRKKGRLTDADIDTLHKAMLEMKRLDELKNGAMMHALREVGEIDENGELTD